MLNIVFTIIGMLLIFLGGYFIPAGLNGIHNHRKELRQTKMRRFLELKDYKRIVLIAIGLIIDVVIIAGIVYGLMRLWLI